MKKTGIVYRKAHGPFDYNGWPTVAKDENGVLYAVFSGHRINHIDLFSKDYLVKSFDGGESWSLPIVVNDSRMDDRDAGICHLGGNRFAITYFCHPIEKYQQTWNTYMLQFMSGAEKIMALGATNYFYEIPESESDYGSFIRITEDGFHSIGDPIKIPVSAPHGPIRMQDGTIGYFGKAMYPAPGTIPEEALYFYRSVDGGKSFDPVGEVPIPEDMLPKQFCEPHVVDLGDGKLFGAIRTHRPEKDEPRATIYYTSSEDGGKSWSTAYPSGLNGLPPHLLLLSDGRILLSYARRAEPNRIEAVISEDGGKTFGAPIVIEEFPQHAYSGDFGYPASVELADGSILTVYYAILEGDEKPSVLYTKWNV